MNKNFSGATVTYGVGFGVVLAMLISFSHTRSVLWTLLHGIFGWFYVIVSLLNGNAQL